MSSWIQWFNILWPVAATLTPIILAAGFLWLKTQFAGAKDVETIKTAQAALHLDVTRLDGEIRSLSDSMESAPTRVELMGQIAQTIERMSRMEAAQEGLQRQIGQQNHAIEQQLKTLSNYVHTLVEQGIQEAKR